MTETPDPAEIERIRRLLAEARPTEPMPEDVAARMDRTLADLGPAPAEVQRPVPAQDPDQVVVSLARRRRRRTAGLLVAAAAVVVGGVTLAQNLPQGSSSSTTSSAGGEAAAQDRAPAESQGLTGGVPPMMRGGRLVVHPDRLRADALAGRLLLGPAATRGPSLSQSEACAGVPAGAGQVLGVSYRQAPAALVYHPPSGGTQTVELYVCGSPRVVRSTTLPAP